MGEDVVTGSSSLDGGDAIRDARVLLVEDDATHATLMRESLRPLCGQIEVAPTQSSALDAIERRSFDIVVLDAGLPDGSGFEIQSRIGGRSGVPPIVFVTSDDRAEHAVHAMRAGAVHYVVKRPNYLDHLVSAVEGILAQPAASRDPEENEILGKSPEMRRVRRFVADAAASAAPVLISGETGTGKDLVAQALHRAGPRRERPFIAVNCPAISPALFESEVFGSVRGAFTGADRDRTGLVGAARNGTLFLDEVGELPPAAQAKLLRLLENGTFRPVGAGREVFADVRIVAATNRDLEPAVSAREFRQDLYFRLKVLHVRLPPLRERRADIPLLVDAMLAEFGSARCVSPEARAQLAAYAWPGNVRELRSAVERALVPCGDGPIARFDLAIQESATSGSAGRLELDPAGLVQLLQRFQGRLGPVAEELGASIRTVQRRMKELGLHRREFRG